MPGTSERETPLATSPDPSLPSSLPSSIPKRRSSIHPPPPDTTHGTRRRKPTALEAKVTYQMQYIDPAPFTIPGEGWSFLFPDSL
ncbi:hypothetical protein CGRA01v4_04828 [Colletotrichum graminicola]|nr:hypothetical protein CGRA01v4_04828 [Colletotrichum graminicola]